MMAVKTALLKGLQFLIISCFTLIRAESDADFVDVSTLSDFNATLTCSMVQNGTFLKDPRACNTWIQCVDGDPISGTCATGLFYNRDKNECVDADSIACYSSDPCATILGDGFVADPYSCNGYYYCYGGKGSRGECSTGLNYNPGTEDCIRNFVCPHEPDPESWCNIIPDNEFFTDLQSCQGYHLCVNYTLENGTCPDGYYFNGFSSICDYKGDVKCSQPEAHPNLPGNEICQKEGQFVSDNATCAGYYYCQDINTNDFQLVWGQCPNGRFFDPTNGGECVDRLQFVCQYNRCDGMGTTGIQLANAPNDACTGYLICQDGQEIGSGVCPSDEEYYDEVTQRCTTGVVAYPACLAIETTTTTPSTTTTLTKEASTSDTTEVVTTTSTQPIETTKDKATTSGPDSTIVDNEEDSSSSEV